MKISQLKLNINTIITSLNKLQVHRDNIAQNPKSLSTEIAEIDKCKENLEYAFSNLKSESLNKLATQVKKRKKQRHTKKLKIKKKYGEARSRGSLCQHDPSTSLPFVAEISNLSSLQKWKLRSSKKYLASIDCLETLHRLRGGGDSCRLKESLNSIKSIWQSTQHCINEKRNNNSLAKCWDKVLFGGKTEIKMVSGLGEFVERRFIWDSYLDSSNGSHIPVGWIYPKDDAKSEWKQFLQLT